MDLVADRRTGARRRDRILLHDVSLRIAPGETHVLFGANGSGKTALLDAIMGLPRYRLERGRILFLEKDVTTFSVDERARLGIGLFFQRPPAVPGIMLTETRGAASDRASMALASKRWRAVSMPSISSKQRSTVDSPARRDREGRVPAAPGPEPAARLQPTSREVPRQASQIELGARGTRGESISRALAQDAARIYLRGTLVGRHDDSRGHLDCRGRLLSTRERIETIPELTAENAPGCQLSHEAAIGPVAEEAVEYLMTRGLTREEAVSVLTRGFVSLKLPGLPEAVGQRLRQVIAATAVDSM